MEKGVFGGGIRLYRAWVIIFFTLLWGLERGGILTDFLVVLRRGGGGESITGDG
jgi:hypothetical protein